MFTEDEITVFMQAASAELAHTEVVEAVASGDLRVTASQLRAPYTGLAELLTLMAVKYPKVHAISFRQNLYLFPRNTDLGLRIIKEDRVVKLDDIT